MIESTIVIFVALFFLALGYVCGNKHPSLSLENKVTFIASVTQSISVILAITIFGYQYFQDKEKEVSDQLKYAFEMVREYNQGEILSSAELVKEYFSKYAAVTSQELEALKRDPSPMISLETKIVEKISPFVNYVFDASTCIEANICDRDFTTTRVCHQIRIPSLAGGMMKDYSSIANVSIGNQSIRPILLNVFKNFVEFENKYCAV
jgi:hypothetical protein